MKNFASFARHYLKNISLVLIIGPRQCGKTTLARLLCKELGINYISCGSIATLASLPFGPCFQAVPITALWEI